MGSPYDGTWSGATDRGTTVGFDVRDRTVNFLVLGVPDLPSPTPGETGLGVIVDLGSRPLPIHDDGRLHYEGALEWRDASRIEFAGTFETNSEARGTCKVDAIEMTWTARKSHVPADRTPEQQAAEQRPGGCLLFGARLGEWRIFS